MKKEGREVAINIADSVAYNNLTIRLHNMIPEMGFVFNGSLFVTAPVIKRLFGSHGTLLKTGAFSIKDNRLNRFYDKMTALDDYIFSERLADNLLVIDLHEPNLRLYNVIQFLIQCNQLSGKPHTDTSSGHTVYYLYDFRLVCDFMKNYYKMSKYAYTADMLPQTVKKLAGIYQWLINFKDKDTFINELFARVDGDVLFSNTGITNYYHYKKQYIQTPLLTQTEALVHKSVLIQDINIGLQPINVAVAHNIDIYDLDLKTVFDNADKIIFVASVKAMYYKKDFGYRSQALKHVLPKVLLDIFNIYSLKLKHNMSNVGKLTNCAYTEHDIRLGMSMYTRISHTSRDLYNKLIRNK
ncbi:hypothetical protein phiCTP1_gp63 [Clostridium phage phiCTP1]|uniref:hypothetical protein n=1 Tax=Clostridium phage phiCTP1 TaxID=871584 RepID=UPI0001E07850|nr:hypothetical protein phiCTP1_gp63 [Clostridium phage phiCTP1]ADL40364.1 hypothetical phage protein [Clostridium phage phiCTP1]